MSYRKNHVSVYTPHAIRRGWVTKTFMLTFFVVFLSWLFALLVLPYVAARNWMIWAGERAKRRLRQRVRVDSECGMEQRQEDAAKREPFRGEGVRKFAAVLIFAVVLGLAPLTTPIVIGFAFYLFLFRSIC